MPGGNRLLGDGFLHANDLDAIYEDFFAEYLLVDGGECVYPKSANLVASNIFINQAMRLNGFRCKRTEVTTKMTVVCSTGAVATPTLVRYGLYLRSGDRNYTLVASTPNDTTLLATANQPFPKNWSVPYTKIRGEEYLAAILCVSGSAQPTLYGAGGVVNAQNNVINFHLPSPPRLASLNGQSDLPASFNETALASTNCGSVQCLIS